MEAKVINFPGVPMLGNKDIKERTAYKAAKVIINAKRLGLNGKLNSLLLMGMSWNRFIRLL